MTRVEETAINLTVQWLQNNGYENADDYLQTGGNLVQLAEDLYHKETQGDLQCVCLLYTSPSPRDRTRSRMPSSA